MCVDFGLVGCPPRQIHNPKTLRFTWFQPPVSESWGLWIWCGFLWISIYGFGPKNFIRPLIFSIRAQTVHPPPWFWTQNVHPPSVLGPNKINPPWFWTPTNPPTPLFLGPHSPSTVVLGPTRPSPPWCWAQTMHLPVEFVNPPLVLLVSVPRFPLTR